MFSFGNLGDLPNVGASGPGIYEQAVLYADFTQDAMRISGTWSSATSKLTTARTAVAQMDSSDGYWGQFASGAPRLSDKGLLVEPARTNSIRNNTMVGAVAGTPGTLPTNWAVAPGVVDGGLHYQVVGVGAEKGVDYVDIRLYGITDQPDPPDQWHQINFDSIVVSAGQVWGTSMFLSLVSGDASNVYVAVGSFCENVTNVWLNDLAMIEYDGGGLPTVLTRLTDNGVGTGVVGTGGVRLIPYIYWFQNDPAIPVDFTVRVGWPQVELATNGANATSPIKTTSAVVTRPVETVNVSTFGWYTQGPGTLWAEFNHDIIHTTDFKVCGLLQTANTDWINLWRWSGALTILRGVVVTGGANQVDAQASFTMGGRHKLVLAYATNDFQGAINGVVTGNDITGTLPVPAFFNLGHAGGGGQLMGYVRRVAYWNSRLSAAVMQALTAP